MHFANEVAFASGGHDGLVTVWGFEAVRFVVADGVAEIVHHNPASEAGGGVFGDEIVFGAGTPEDAGMDAEHRDDAVVFFLVLVGKDGGLNGDKAIGHEFLDFGGIGDFVKEESTVGFDDERHLTSLFGGFLDDCALEADGELTEFSLEIVGLADHHGVDEALNAFGIG